MKRLLPPVALLLASTLAVAAQQPSAPELSSVEAAIRSEVERQKVPGAAVAVVKDGRVLLAKGYGQANVGIVTVPDARLAVLQKIARTNVVIPAAIVFSLIWMDRTRFRYAWTVGLTSVLLLSWWVLPFVWDHGGDFVSVELAPPSAEELEAMEGPLVDEFRQALAEIRMGRTRRDALRDADADGALERGQVRAQHLHVGDDRRGTDGAFPRLGALGARPGHHRHGQNEN